MQKVVLLLSFSLLWAGSTLAQVNFFCSQDTIPVSQTTYSVPVRVADFEEVVGTQFTLSWDTTVLAYQGVSGLSDFLSEIEHFGVDNVSRGILRFAWFNNALTGTSLADGSSLFVVDFAVRGLAGSNTTLGFIDEPTVREVVDTSFGVINATFNDGLLYLDAVSQLKEVPAALRLERIQPNPPGDINPRLYFYLKKADNVIIRVVNLNGQEVYRAAQAFAAGQQMLELDRAVFTQPGMYVIRLQTDQYLTTQKLMISK
jgi:hypothetical protein